MRVEKQKLPEKNHEVIQNARKVGTKKSLIKSEIGERICHIHKKM